MYAAWHLHKAEGTPQTHSQFLFARSRYNSTVRAAKRMHDEKIIEQMTASPNLKTWYRLSQKLYKGSALKENIPNLTTSDGIATTASEKATALNSTFVSKASNVIAKSMPPIIIQTTKCLDWVEISSQTVRTALQKLDPTKTPGPDNIHNLTLKKCADSLCNPLALLFNRSLSEGTLPTEWKLAEVTAIYKHKGSRNDPTNYRPISLTSSVCKVMERIINSELLRHLTVNKLITSNQFCFLPNTRQLTN